MDVTRSAIAVALLALAVVAQQPDSDRGVEPPAVPAGLQGSVRVCCSDLLLSCSELMARDFVARATKVRVEVVGGGSGASIQWLLEGKIDVAVSARPLRKAELAKLAEKKVEFVEVPVAVEAIALVVPRDNDWLDFVTVDEFRRLWTPSDAVRTWKHVRDSWPDIPIERFVQEQSTGFAATLRPVLGEHADRMVSATLLGEEKLYVAVGAARGGLGMTDSVSAAKQTRHVRLVAVDAGAGPVSPTEVGVGNGHYAPLSRPLLLYVHREVLARPEVEAFVRFYLANGRRVASELQMVAASGALRRCAERVITGRETGTRFLDEKGEPREGALVDLFRSPTEGRPSK
jgi:phosphate transport system substrate-binding protein